MPIDAHCHLRDLIKRSPNAEEERRNQGLGCAASAWNLADFVYHEKLSQKALQDKGPRIFCCFGVHPQLPASSEKHSQQVSSSLMVLETLAAENRLHAIGETGFDLFDQTFRNTEVLQDQLFAVHLELAVSKELPLVLHVRKAMHKIFAQIKVLKRLRSVIFHSYPGTLGEGEALLKRGVNAYFSFGNPMVQGRKDSMRSCAGLPPERLLIETDAPYQHLPGGLFSHWQDLPAIRGTMARLREAAGHPQQEIAALESILDSNFYRAYCELEGNPQD
ncbi:MAG: TatD family hydrolase [Treponema sp.]|jgi:TatD DNase family protein|nr:TatD family hydrolase [Treponema sp.]